MKSHHCFQTAWESDDDKLLKRPFVFSYKKSQVLQGHMANFNQNFDYMKFTYYKEDTFD